MAPKIVVSRWPATVAASEASPVLAMLAVSQNDRGDWGKAGRSQGRNRFNKRVYI